LLGINGVCIIAHGGSNSKAIKNAIYRAHELIEKKINEHISEDIEANLDAKGGFWQHIKEIVSGDEDATLVTIKDERQEILEPEKEPPSK